jgi:lipid-binding SYLF domain-containing protein
MLTKRRCGLIIALLLAVGSSAQAADEAAVVKRATKLLEEISSDPESGIPTQYLREAKGIVIMPGLVDTRLIVGRRRGHGLLLRRDEKGKWSDVKFVEISGASVGAIAGREVVDMVIIYRTKTVADDSGDSSVKLAASLKALGSLKQREKFGGSGPDSWSRKNVVTYARSRGIMVGATISGELKWVPHPEPVATKSRPPSDHIEADVKTSLAGSIPEVSRLTTLLAAITTEHPAQVGKTGTKDPKVSPASAAEPSAKSVASP